MSGQQGAPMEATGRHKVENARISRDFEYDPAKDMRVRRLLGDPQGVKRPRRLRHHESARNDAETM